MQELKNITISRLVITPENTMKNIVIFVITEIILVSMFNNIYAENTDTTSMTHRADLAKPPAHPQWVDKWPLICGLIRSAYINGQVFCITQRNLLSLRLKAAKFSLFQR